MTRPLRFCFLATFYPPFNFGGDGIGIQRLARGLVRHGHHVTVVHDRDAYRLLHGGPDPTPETVDDGVEVIGLETPVGALSCLLTQQTGSPVINGPRIRRLVREGGYDVVNLHNASLIGGPGLFSVAPPEALTLYMAHEHWLVCPSHVLWRHGRELCDGRECLRCQLSFRRPPQLWRGTGLMERALDHIDTFIAVSEFSRDKHHEFGFPREMEVLNYFLPDPEPVPPTPSASPHGRPYFLFVGRLEKIKGLDGVIPLFRDLPGTDLVIAGDGEWGSELRRLAEGLDNVRFLGRVPLDDLRGWYEHAVALIVPSVCYETFGIIIIEAFRYGTPVIARRLGPFPEILDRSGGGELFDNDDELIMAMQRLQEDPQRRARLADSGHRAYREHWVESSAIPRYLDIVRRTAEKRGRQDLAAMLTPMEVS